MVLAALGDVRNEHAIANVLGSYPFGTPASRVTRLAQWAYQVQFGAFSIDELRDAVQQHHSPIVFVRADVLPWADFGGFHAVVLVEITTDAVLLLDPALETGPTRLAMDYFLLAWEEFDHLTAIISK
jgi:ABC-type bacteriocin/lantibiotic exporter with double-glycine peptidase domain